MALGITLRLDYPDVPQHRNPEGFWWHRGFVFGAASGILTGILIGLMF